MTKGLTPQIRRSIWGCRGQMLGAGAFARVPRACMRKAGAQSSRTPNQTPSTPKKIAKTPIYIPGSSPFSSKTPPRASSRASLWPNNSVSHSPRHPAAARRYSHPSADNPRSNLVAHRHALTRVTTVCRVNTSLRTAAPPARHDHLKTFQYGADNRLQTIQITKDGEAAKITQLHNAAGQRVFKSEPQTAQTLPNETQLGTGFVAWLKTNFSWLYATAQTNASLGTAFTYADTGGGAGGIPSWAILGEYDNGSASGTGRIEYIWLPTEDGSAIPVAMFRGSRYYQIHSDHLGTPRLITDDQAKPVWQWAYSAFGDNKPTGLLKTTTNPNNAITNQPGLLQVTAPMEFSLRFPGQYADSETGQFYNYFRNYQATQGRYTQNDPIGLLGGSNRTLYGNANALSSTDPLGLWSLEVGIFGGLGGNITIGKDPATGQKFGIFQFGYGIGGGAMYDPNGGLPKNLTTSSCEEETFIGGFGKAGVAGPGAALDVVSATGGINWTSGRPYGGVDWFTPSYGTKWGVKAEASGGIQFGKVGKPTNLNKCTCPGSRG
jgi:RHS repeat-associated protein